MKGNNHIVNLYSKPLNLLYELIIIQIKDAFLDNFINIITNYSQLKNFLKYCFNKNIITKFLLFNKNNIHNLLYESDEIIHLDTEIIEKELYNYFNF